MSQRCYYDDMKRRWTAGFTIIEVLIVIVVIGIIASISFVSYNGVQTRSRQAKIETDLTAVQKLIESYKARTGNYPITAASLNPNWSATTANTDANCSMGTRKADWVPDIPTALPQSQATTAISGNPGCYIYVSDGTSYVLSAWNMIRDPQTEKMYRRLGFRETDASHANQFYTCNHSGIGGVVGGSYDIDSDYYKHSMTLSNVTTCGETPPAGA